MNASKPPADAPTPTTGNGKRAARPSGGPGAPVPGLPADGGWTYWTQPDAYLDKENDADNLPEAFPFFVYLKVWERFITAVEDPDILETALGSLQSQSSWLAGQLGSLPSWSSE